MSYYRTCPICGAHLDAGERCDCRNAQETNVERQFKVSAEFVACMLELSSELGFLLDHGVNEESMEIIEAVNNRLAALIEELRKENAA